MNVMRTLWGLRHDALPVSVLAFLITLLLVVAGDFAYRVAGELRDLRASHSDNAIWTISQSEVDYVEFQRSLGDPRSSVAPDLAELRRTFDVFYARLMILRESSLYVGKIQAAQAAGQMAQLTEQVDSLIPMIDAPDAELIAQRADLIAKAADIRQQLRGLTGAVLQKETAQNEQSRAQITHLLTRLATVSLLLLVSSALLIAVIWRLFIFARRRARDNLEISRRLSATFGASQDAIVLTDAVGDIVEFNNAAGKMFGIAAKEAIGRSFAELCILAPGQGDTSPQRVTGKRADGQQIPLELTRGKARSDVGDAQIYVLRDISQRLAIEDDLRRSRDDARASERAKARFMAVMSHEMRTPLNGILGAVDLLRANHVTPDALPYLEVMESSGAALLGHVNDVLDIAQIEATGVGLTQEPVDLSELCTSVVRALMPGARLKGLALNAELHIPEALYVTGDPARLRQILTNLLSNAIKYTEQGEVQLEAIANCTGQECKVELRVSDTGQGIDEDQHDRIFDDFVRLLPDDDSLHKEGTGLGLGITRRLVHAMGGQIGVESEPGEGSLFWVQLSLPKAQAPLSTSPVRSVPDAEAPSLNVLMVEDNAVNRFVLREMLERDGHKVTEAVDGREGAIKAAQGAYDLILMDISMPVMDGTEAVRLIRSGNGPSAKTRIIALTAHVLASQTAHLQDAGFDGMVNKPLTWEGLRALLRGEAPSGPQPPQAQKDVPLLDKRALSTLSAAIPPERMASLLADLHAEGDMLIAALDRDALVAALKPRVHGFAGAAATFGCLRLHRMLCDIEEQLNNPGASPEAAPLADLWTQTKQALGALELPASAG